LGKYVIGSKTTFFERLRPQKDRLYKKKQTTKPTGRGGTGYGMFNTERSVDKLPLHGPRERVLLIGGG